MKLCNGLLAILSPCLIVAGMQLGGEYGAAIALVLAAALWFTSGARGGVSRLLPLAIAILALLSMLVDSTLPLRYYPVLVNAVLCAVFAWSMLFPPSIAERIAKLTDPELPAYAVRYTRRVTGAWIVFFVINGSIAWWTARYGSDVHWALYNGAIAYVLIGTMFVGELLVRRVYARKWQERTP